MNSYAIKYVLVLLATFAVDFTFLKENVNTMVIFIQITGVGLYYIIKLLGDVVEKLSPKQ
jgi:hypothetical protein